MLQALIIAYGNPLRGDDSLGWRAAELLAELPEFAGNPSVEIVTCHQLTPELAERVSQADRVIFIDASHGPAPGTVKCEPLTPDASRPEALGHHFTPLRVLAYARAIFGAAPRAVAISVAAESMELGNSLSPAVAAALPKVLALVREQIG